MEMTMHRAPERGSPRSYDFVRGVDYGAVVAASERVAWKVDHVFEGRRFDPSRPLVPSAWVGTGALAFLSERVATLAIWDERIAKVQAAP